MTERGTESPIRRLPWLAGRGWSFPILGAAALLFATILMRSAAGPTGVGFLNCFKASAAFMAVGLLPGYLLLRAFGGGRGAWLDWLSPSFCASMVLACAFSVPAYMFGWPLWIGGAWLAGVSLVCLGMIVLRRSPLENASGTQTSFLAGTAAFWHPALDAVAVLAMAVTAAISLQHLESTGDLWFHGAGIDVLSRSGFVSMADPFHDTAEPHPMYFMNLWYVLVAMTGRMSCVMTVDIVRVLPVLLVPVAISGFAWVLKAFLEEGRARLLGMGLFIAYYTFLATSMESSPNSCMWTQFGVPRWVALFGVYPLALALGVMWMLAGGWHRAVLAAVLGGMAIFVHPQGAQWYMEVVGCVLLGSVLARSGVTAARACLALVVAAALVAPFFLLRHAYLRGAIGGGEVSMFGLADDSASSFQAILKGNFQSIEFSRAANLLGSPLFAIGLILVPLWWKEIRKDPRRLVLILALGPALCLPFVPFLQLLPVHIYPNLLYRGVWAAPVLVASALALDRLLRRAKEEGRTPPEGVLPLGIWGWSYAGAFALALVILHIWRPAHYERWWREDSLAAVLVLAALFVAVRWRPQSGLSWRSCWPLLPVTTVAVCLVVRSFLPGKTDGAEQFAAGKESRAVKALARETDKRGYVLADSILSAHLTALAGVHTLGGVKTATFAFSGENRAMNEDLMAMLRGDGPLADFLDLLRKRDVRRVCIFPDRSRSLAERLERFPSIFPVLEEDRGIRLYGVDLSLAAVRTEAEKLVARAREAEPQMTLALLEDAEALGGSELAVPQLLADARRRADLPAGSNDLSSTQLVPADLHRLLELSRLHVRAAQLHETRRRMADSLLTSGHLIRMNSGAFEPKLEFAPAARSGAVGPAAIEELLPATWLETNEVCLRVSLGGPRLVETVSVRVGPGRPRKMPELVRMRLCLQGSPPVWVDMKGQWSGQESERGASVYTSEPVIISADQVELRFFLPRAEMFRVAGLELNVLCEPATTGGRAPARTQAVTSRGPAEAVPGPR